MNIDQVKSRLRFIARETRREADYHRDEDRRRLIRNAAQLSHASTMLGYTSEQLEALLEAGTEGLVQFACKRVPPVASRG